MINLWTSNEVVLGKSQADPYRVGLQYAQDERQQHQAGSESVNVVWGSLRLFHWPSVTPFTLPPVPRWDGVVSIPQPNASLSRRSFDFN